MHPMVLAVLFVLIDRMIQVNITEQMVDAQPQEIITNDNLNARVSGNAKIVIPSGSELVNVIGEMAGVLPLREATR